MLLLTSALDGRVLLDSTTWGAGEAVLSAEDDDSGEAHVFVGSRDTGPAVVVTKGGIDAWIDGELVRVVPRM